MTYPTIATMVKPQKMEIDQNVNTFPQVNPKPVSNTLLTSSSLDAVMDMKPMGSIESDGLLTYPLYIV